MQQWVITDTHFHHQAMRDYCGRPEDFTERILRNWRESVTADDVVIHLGDVIVGQDARLGELLAAVPGRKILVRGNHDEHPTRWYLQHGFDFVCDSFAQDGLLFTHAPVAQDALCGCRLNLCGHLHTFIPEAVGEPPVGARNYVLSLEHMDYSPRPLEEILAGAWHRRDLHGEQSDERIDTHVDFAITKEQYQHYLHSAKGQCCPRCTHPQSTIQAMDWCVATVEVERVCAHCGFRWKDIHSLSGILIVGAGT